MSHRLLYIAKYDFNKTKKIQPIHTFSTSELKRFAGFQSAGEFIIRNRCARNHSNQENLTEASLKGMLAPSPGQRPGF